MTKYIIRTWRDEQGNVNQSYSLNECSKVIKTTEREADNVGRELLTLSKRLYEEKFNKEKPGFCLDLILSHDDI